MNNLPEDIKLHYVGLYKIHTWEWTPGQFTLMVEHVKTHIIYIHVWYLENGIWKLDPTVRYF